MTSSDANSNSEVVNRRLGPATNHDFPRNSWFRSPDAALLARRLNVPFVLISCAARTNAPHAANARPEPTEIRRTPRSVNWESESWWLNPETRMFTGFGATVFTI